MSPLCYVLAAATIVFAVTCVLLRSKNKSFEGMLFKFMASFGFISVAIVGFSTDPKSPLYFCLICFSLMFGFFGDVLLGIKEIAPLFRGRLIPLGLGYFTVGHIFFLAAIMCFTGFSTVNAAIAVVGAIIAFFLIKTLKMKVNNALRTVMSVYYGILIYKVATAATLVMCSPKISSIILLVASICFITSDTCLALLYFTPVKRKNIWVTIELATYYPAQILAAMSVALI